MKRALAIVALAILFRWGVLLAFAQDAAQNPPLGDVARKSRQQPKAASKHVLNEETASKQGVPWSASACHTIPCAQLTVLIPADAKNGSAALMEKRIALPGNNPHELRFFMGNQLPASDLGTAKWALLQDWFSRPYYFGTSAKFDFDEQTKIDNYQAVLTHFTIGTRALNYRGIALFVAVPSGTFGFACVYREQDSGDATGVCEAILNSAKVKMPENYRYYTPPSYMNDDP